MTPLQANEIFCAQFYTTMKDGITPQMFYKYETIYFNDGTNKNVLCYLSFANIWMGSGLTKEYTRKELMTKLIPIG